MKKLMIGLAIVLLGILFSYIYVKSDGLLQQEPTPQPLEGSKPPLETLPIAGPASQLMAAQPQPTPSPVDLAVQSAFQAAAQEGKTTLLALMIYTPVVDRIQYSQDGSTAVVWVALKDPQTGEVIATEPGLAIEHLVKPDAPELAGSWAVTLQSSPSLMDEINALPPDLLTDDLRDRYLQTGEAQLAPSLTAAFTGYKLPWTAGLAKRLTGSVGHFLDYNSCSITSCRYAYDWADGTMFPLLASKGGVVKSFRWTCLNGDPNCTNFFILEDRSTVPTSYQVYYHMAYNSIPARLRVVGTPVLQGEYVGDVDDTGASTGHHLHFHVYTTPSPSYSDWRWGNSVDFIYDEITINGGHPRTCFEAANHPTYGTECNAGADGKRGTSDDDKFVSGNTPAHPPLGTWDVPGDRLTLTTNSVSFSGTAQDDIQIARIQVFAYYSGSWKPAGDLQYSNSGTYSGSINLCDNNIPDGPMALTVGIYDREGSQALGIPIRQYIKNYACGGNQAPTASLCLPNDNQVALYPDPDFRGTCQLFDAVAGQATAYTADMLLAAGDNNAASIQVGRAVQAVLYDHSPDVTSAEVTGRVETLESSDPSLADNRIGSDHVSGLWVQPRTATVDEPFINAPGNNYDGSLRPTSADSLVLAWKGGAGGTAFNVSLKGQAGHTADLQTTTTNSYLSVGTLPADTYTLTVKSFSSTGENTGNPMTFTVDPGSLPSAAAASVPYSDGMESGAGSWVATGQWRLGLVTIGGRAATNAWIFNNSTTSNYQDTARKAGDLTTPPISIPSGTTSFLRFSYYVKTEDDLAFWDQRRVQVSVNNGPFVDLMQLSDDKQTSQVWLNSGPVSLNPYAGQTIRLRFHFDAVDEDYNNFAGWMIDDISINTSGPSTGCADNDANPNLIPSISLGTPVSGVICPEGDIDYYKLSGLAGQALIADIDARTLSPASSLDTHIYLLDADRVSVLTDNDDEKYNTLLDSLMPYTLTRSGTYYIKVKAWNHPGVGGSAFPYRLTLRTQPSGVPPKSVQILFPANPFSFPLAAFKVTAGAVDYDDGDVSAVQFYWHGSDWNNPGWTLVGTDSNPADGWSMDINPAPYGAVAGSALYVQAVSKSGATGGVAWWSVQTDNVPPVTQITPLPAVTNSTVVKVSWTGTDPVGSISYYELQYQVDGGAWSDIIANKKYPASVLSIWAEMPAGKKIGFRLRGVDGAGNVEAYPAQAEAVTTIAAACLPDASEALGQSLSSAVQLTRSTISASYNFCASSASGANDVDWLVFDAEQGERLMVFAVPTDGGAGLTITVYAGTTTLMQVGGSWSSSGYSMPVIALWAAPAKGTYYLEVKPFHAAMFGTDMRYRVSVGPPNQINLPIIQR